jgi:hypothetical protein
MNRDPAIQEHPAFCTRIPRFVTVAVVLIIALAAARAARPCPPSVLGKGCGLH